MVKLGGIDIPVEDIVVLFVYYIQCYKYPPADVCKRPSGTRNVLSLHETGTGTGTDTSTGTNRARSSPSVQRHDPEPKCRRKLFLILLLPYISLGDGQSQIPCANDESRPGKRVSTVSPLAGEGNEYREKRVGGKNKLGVMGFGLLGCRVLDVVYGRTLPAWEGGEGVGGG